MKKKCIAIILAAGQGRRMGTKIKKQYLEILGIPVLVYALRVFEQSELIDEIIVVAAKGEEAYMKKNIVEEYHIRKVSAIVTGGKERYDSVYHALQLIDRENKGDSIIFIHDGARPFPNEAILRRTYEEANQSGACVAGMPVKDTIKVVDHERHAIQTPDRRNLWMVQTPQVFQGTLIIEAYKKMMQQSHEAVTDDAMAVELMTGHPVRLVEGSYENIKITTPEDIKIAEVFASDREIFEQSDMFLTKYKKNEKSC